MNQKDGVYSAVVAVFGAIDSVGTTGSWSEAQRSAVTAHVYAAFKEGRIEYKGGLPEDAKLSKYIPGLVNNWVRKDTRLNGGSKYTTKNPGSRTGSGDESVKAMKMLLSATTDPEMRTQIQAEIDKRLNELKPKPEINAAALPESLRHLVAA